MKVCGEQSASWIAEAWKWFSRKPRLCLLRTGDPFNTRGSSSESMRSSKKQALSTWGCSWIVGLAFGGHLKIASVVHSKLLYAAPVWANALQYHAIQRKLFSAQRLVALRILSAYRTVSMSGMLVPTSVPPIDLLAEERQETFQLRKKLTCTDLQEIARAKEAIRKDGRRRHVEKWQMIWHGEQTGRWTYRLIPVLATWLNRKHGEVGFYFA